MNENSVIVNEGSALTNRLQRLQFIRKFYLTIGQAATKGQLIVQRSIRAGSDDMSPHRFVESLRQLAQRGAAQEASDLESVLIRSNEVLASATTVFPLTLFPDTITLDRTKLTIVNRTFFLSEDVMSIRIEDILNVSATVGPIFGSITIATRVMSSDDHFTLKNFLREDVMHLKHMIHGYVIARHNNIACDHLSHDDLVRTLRELGHETSRHRFPIRTAPAPQKSI